jgi:trehalose-phosphatase
LSTGRESALPPSWQTASSQATWWARVRSAPSSVLILDYDGTLAPFTLDRMKSWPYPGVDERLKRLLTCETVSVIVVTGRSWRELMVVYPLTAHMEVWASHGREHATADGEYYFLELTAGQKSILGEIMRDPALAALPPDSVERKPASIAIHWRGLEPDEQEMLRKQVLNPFQRHVTGGAVALLPFEDGVELRATGRTKGDAVRDIRARFPPEIPIAYLGDDHTDEEAFAAMAPEDLALLVRPAPRGTLANYWITAPDGVLHFLDRWIDETGAAAGENAEDHLAATGKSLTPKEERPTESAPLVERRGHVAEGAVQHPGDA